MNRRGFFWTIMGGVAAILAPKGLMADLSHALRNKVQAGLATVPTFSPQDAAERCIVNMSRQGRQSQLALFYKECDG